MDPDVTRRRPTSRDISLDVVHVELSSTLKERISFHVLRALRRTVAIVRRFFFIQWIIVRSSTTTKNTLVVGGVGRVSCLRKFRRNYRGKIESQAKLIAKHHQHPAIAPNYFRTATHSFRQYI